MSDLDLQSIRDDLKKMGRLGAKQVQAALRAFSNADLTASDRIVEGDNVIDALNLSIEEKSYGLCFSNITAEEKRFIRSAVKVGANLERIGDAACHIARRVQIMDYDRAEPVDFEIAEMESISLAAIRESLDSYLNGDIKQAECACLREPQLDAIYRVKIEEIKERMRLDPGHVGSLLNWYSVIKYLEKICDCTLNIGEQAIFLVTGRRLKFAQYQQLDRLASHSSVGHIEYHPYYDGISGALVARIDNGTEALVLKTGSKKKIDAESAKLKQWEEIFPSMTPKVISTVIHGDRETLLREFVAGDLLSELYYSDRSMEEKEKATRKIMDILLKLWGLTLKAETPTIDYTEQIRSRLSEVYAMHPYLEYYAINENIDDLLEKIKRMEIQLRPPFSVWLHGDFNINNIIYNEGLVKFIDVHRSNYGDYLCDVGVFMVSTIRHAPGREAVLEDMTRVREIVTDRIAGFAKEQNDCNWEPRLRLSLARSYITSARVIIDEMQARTLFETGLSLLKKEVNR